MPDTETRLAGRELDVLVAERYMGWRDVHVEHEEPKEWHQPHLVGVDTAGYTCSIGNYSTEMYAAKAVLDRWEGDYHIRRQNGVYFVEFFRPSEQWSDYGETLPEAICRAALRTVGVAHA